MTHAEQFTAVSSRCADWTADYSRCNMGVGCDEVGICYAEKNNRPDLCPSRAAIAKAEGRQP